MQLQNNDIRNESCGHSGWVCASIAHEAHFAPCTFAIHSSGYQQESLTLKP